MSKVSFRIPDPRAEPPEEPQGVSSKNGAPKEEPSAFVKDLRLASISLGCSLLVLVLVGLAVAVAGTWR